MIILRNAKEEDIPVIQRLADKTWRITYADYISAAQLDYMLENMYDTGTLLSQLREGHSFLIAEEGGKDLGFAGFSVIDSENHIYKLHKLYVLPEAHGKGIGKLLINEVVNLVKRSGGKSLELNVNRQNKAKDFYKRIGFNIKETVDIEIGKGFFMNDYIMEKAL